jgi:hypothetical protein
MTRFDLHSRSLYSIASELHFSKQRQRAQGAAEYDVELAALVRQFRRLRPYAFAAHDQCLFHALTLTRFLGAHGVYPTWVIGVRLRPWGAHSWVQHDHWLLDATPEAVREYTPILAV